MLKPRTTCLLRQFCQAAAVLAILTQIAVAQLSQLPTIPIHTAADDSGNAYGTWASGRNYKVSFHDGAVFVPYLGRQYPHNQSWRWQTVSAQIGSHDLLRGEGRLSHGRLRAEYDFGGVVEAYDVLANGVEQTFVIAQAPAVEGDLVIRGEVTSQLTAAKVDATQQSLVFCDQVGRAIIDYGRATAIDANGQAFAMTTGHADGVITLRLSAADLSRACMPLVVDPLISGAASIPNLGVDEMDVVRDSESPADGTWTSVVVAASASDTDLFMYRWSDSGSFIGVVYSDITANWATNGGSLAYNAASNYVVCVFDRTTTAGIRRLRFHRHHRTSNSLATGYALIHSTDSSWRADIGGTDLGFSGANLLVVWQQEPNGGPFTETSGSGIYGCSINTLSNSAATPFVIADGLFSDMERPSINQVSAGSFNNSWLVAYQTISTLVFNDDFDVAVHEVDTAGAVSPPTYIDNASSDHKMAPQIAGSNGRYLVAYSIESGANSAPSSIYGPSVRLMRLDWSLGAGAGTEPWPADSIGALGAQHYASSLAYDRNDDSHWLVTTKRTFPSAARMYLVGYRGEALRDHEVAGTTYFTQQVIAAPVSFDAVANEFVGVRWASGYSQLGLPPVASKLDTWRYRYAVVTPATTAGPSCSTASIAWSGSQLIGSEFGTVNVTGAAVDSVHLMALSLAPGALPLTGIPPFANGCWLHISSVSPDLLGLFPVAIGASPSFPLPLPEFLQPSVMHFQDLHTVGNGNLDFVTTERLEVPVHL